MMYLELLWGFLKVGCFAFGGGYGVIPLIRDVVLSHGWMDEQTLSYMIAVSESTPGPIMVNMATYVGSSQGGIPGALLATLAVVLPSFLIMLVVMGILKNALQNRHVQAVLRGVKPCVVGIVLATGIHMVLRNCLEGMSPDWTAMLMTGLLVGAMAGYRKLTKKKLSPIGLIVLSAILGAVVYGI